MSGCPGWYDSLDWQDYMFQKIDEGNTIKQSFDLATAQYPLIAPCVVFVGDVNLKSSDIVVHGIESDRSTFKVEMSKNKPLNLNLPFQTFLENHPGLFLISRQLHGL